MLSNLGFGMNRIDLAPKLHPLIRCKLDGGVVSAVPFCKLGSLTGFLPVRVRVRGQLRRIGDLGGAQTWGFIPYT